MWVVRIIMLQELRDVTAGMSTAHMLEYLIKDRFPGKTAATVSLKSPGIVVLKLISDIDPSTPVFFCQPQPVFPESDQYRTEIVKLLGLTHVKLITRSDPLTASRPYDHSEWLWNEAAARGKTREVIHLNETLSPYKCWIKAVYHERSAGPEGHRLDVCAGMVIVNLLHGRTTETIDRFMHAHKLPYHPKITPRKKQAPAAGGPVIGYHF